MTNIVILGAGDCGKEVAAFIEDINRVEKKYNILGFLEREEKLGQSCGKYKVIGKDEDLSELVKEYDCHAVIAMQEGDIRKKIAQKLDFFDNWETIVHPTAYVNESVELGKGTIVCPHVSISVDTQVGKHCFFSIGATVGHDCIIGDYVSLMPGSTLCGHVHVGERTYIATNASVIPGMEIGANVTLGVNSSAMENIQDDVVVFGNPGRIMMKKRKPKEKV